MFCLFYLAGNTKLSAQNWDWAQSAGGTYYPEEGRAIVSDQDGNVYVTGTHRNFAFFDWFPITSTGGGDIFLTKFDQQGTFQWVIRLGGSGTDKGNGLSLDGQGNIFLAGQADLTAGPFQGIHPAQGGFGSRHLLDGIIAKYAPDANLQWIKAIDGTVYTIARDIAADANGNSYTVGTFDGLCYFDLDTTATQGQDDIFITRIDAFGGIQWAKSFGGTGDEGNPHVEIAPNGDAIVAASFEGTAYFGNDSLVSYHSKDLLLVRYNSSGNVLWQRSYSGRGAQAVEGLALDASGNIVIAGHFEDTLWLGNDMLISKGYSDIFAARFDGLGNPVSAISLGSSGNESVGDLGLARGSRLVIGGSFNDHIPLGNDTIWASGASDAFLISIDTAWNVLWGKSTGVNDREHGLGASVDPMGNGFIAGFYTSKAIFGQDTLQTNGFEEIFFAKHCASREFNLSAISQPLCPGGSISTTLEVWGCLDSGNVFILELSDSSGAFALPVILDTLFNPEGGIFSGILPATLPEGQNYRLRVRSTAPVFLGPDNGYDLVLARPVVSIAGDSLICPAGDSVELTAGNAFSTYVWNTGDSSQSIWVNTAGIYSVTVTDANGCTNQAQLEVSICIGLDDEESSGWKVYPNPAREWVEIELNSVLQGQNKLRFLDLRGKVLWEGEIGANQRQRINLTGFSAGIYFLEMNNAGQKSRRKLVKF